MNILNDKSDITTGKKADMEMVQQEKQEYKLLETYIRTPGLSLFYYNTNKKRVERVEFKQTKNAALVVDFENKAVIDYEHDKCTVDPRFEYFEALNFRSAENRVEKWKDGKIKLSNLRVATNNQLKLY